MEAERPPLPPFTTTEATIQKGRMAESDVHSVFRETR